MEFRSGTVCAPVSGTAIPSDEIPDETFATDILGRGVGINPDMGLVMAPFDGVISYVTDTHHAVGITSPDGIELLIHIGVDTVDMKGEGFECLVEAGQQVKTGEKLIIFDREKIAAANHPDCVVVLVMNAKNYKDLSIQTGPCKILDSVIAV